MFCASYFDVHGLDVTCEATCCAPCCKPLGTLPYPIKAQIDEEGELLDSGDPGRFMTTRAGMMLFRCSDVNFVILEILWAVTQCMVNTMMWNGLKS
jgi:hypothetical protein